MWRSHNINALIKGKTCDARKTGVDMETILEAGASDARHRRRSAT